VCAARVRQVNENTATTVANLLTDGCLCSVLGYTVLNALQVVALVRTDCTVGFSLGNSTSDLRLIEIIPF
jgi:hypothetical protein